MQFHLDVINVLIAAIAVLNTLYGLTVFSRNRSNTTNQAFFLLTIMVSLWGVSMLFLRSAVNPDVAVWAARALYATAAGIPFASVYFASLFPSEKRNLTYSEKSLVPMPYLAILIFSLLPNIGLVEQVLIQENAEPVIKFNLIQHTLYTLYIVGYFSWVYVILFKKFFQAKDLLRVQLGYILIGTLTTTGIAVLTNLLLPYFGIFTLNWVGQIGILAMITFIMYSILKHHLFSINVIATEIFVVVLQLTLFSQIFIAQTLQERFLSIGIFVGSLGIGILLIRSVIREVEARQHIEVLAENLKVANEKLKEVDKLKNQFLSFVTHELRTPLTHIRGFISLMVDGTYGKVPPAAEEGMHKIFDSATDMAGMVDNYLNVSRIEQGKMKYDMATMDYGALLNEAVPSFLSPAKQKGLKLDFTPTKEKFTIKGDASKLREVLSNLINNALHYTEAGSITLTVEQRGRVVRTTVADTGIGMSTDTIKNRLFKFFSTAENSRMYNPKSTGVGMYISKAHVDVHKGRLWAESEGEGKGSRFIMELPLA